MWLRGLGVAAILLASFALWDGLFMGGGQLVWDDDSSPIKSDETVEFFPTYGQLSSDGKEWQLRVHGWIYEPIQETTVRRAALSALRLTLGLEKGETETDLFVQRAGLFLTDNERGKRIPVRFGEKSVVRLAASKGNGHFEMIVALPVAEVERLLEAQDGPSDWLRFSAVVRDGDQRSFSGRIQLLSDAGVSVVSDIDDTIKITQVTDHKALVRNTFLRPYRVVPGMAKAYRSLAGDGVQFHYLSNSPWQLYGPLSQFFTTEAFPGGTYHMRPFRLKDSSIVKFLGSPEQHKRSTLEALLERFKQRRFVLVGDTGERDPEIYGDVGRRFPEQVQRILLRDPSGDGSVTPRLRTALRDIPAEKWQVFADAGEVKWSGVAK